jgi:hypothetical protein
MGYADGPPLRALGQLAGRKLGDATFFPDIAEATDAIESWMPLYYLPLGRYNDGLGLHLRPQDVSQGRLAFMWADDEHAMIEIGGSPEQLTHLVLLAEEGLAHEYDDRASLDAAVAEASRVFGPGFHRPGAHGSFKAEDRWRILIDKFGGAPYAFEFAAITADEPQQRLDSYRAGIAAEPGCLRMYAGAVKALVELGRRREAADELARSLECYHHTAYITDLDEYFDLGRSLLGEFPEPFSEDARWTLTEKDPRKWARRAGELFNAGQTGRADKLLNDVCYGTGDYASALPAFRKHYEALGWKWALALCRLRGR